MIPPNCVDDDLRLDLRYSVKLDQKIRCHNVGLHSSLGRAVARPLEGVATTTQDVLYITLDIVISRLRTRGNIWA